jgi:Kef-type K+ transport system membrane component KefB
MKTSLTLPGAHARAAQSRRAAGCHVALLLPIMLASWSGPVTAGVFDSLHKDPIAPVILGVTGILFFAILGRFAARKLGLPSVLGEVTMGIILGNVAYYLGLDLITVLREGPAIFDLERLAIAGESLDQAAFATLGADSATDVLRILQSPHGGQILQVAQTVDVFSRYGVIFMLFLVGLDTSIDEMRRVGADSMRVAVIGVVVPFVLGFMATRLLMPDLSLNTDLFIAATLGATSVGITARVLKDLRRQQSHEAHIILGAAVIDDILGLLMLAIVSGIVVSGSVELVHVLTTILLAILFLGSALYFGPYLIRFAVRLLCRLDLVEAKMFTSYLFVMVLAWFANLVGLATIVGAFTAGLILSDSYFKFCNLSDDSHVSIKSLIMPLEVILVPIFFILMGIQVKLEMFFDFHVLMMAAGLLVAAILGKIAAGIGARHARNRIAVGLGMMPRGEVGLIFAAIGKSLGVITDALFSAVVLMVIVTTLLAPPLLKLSMRQGPVQEQEVDRPS